MQITWLSENPIEEGFLRYLLGTEIRGGEISDTEIVVYSGLQREPSEKLLALVNGPRRSRRILVHLSDEKLRHRNQVYSHFDLVLRNYFDPRLAWKRNVVFIPLGWTEAFGFHGSPPGENARNTWSFCGAIKADRAVMIREFETVAGGFHHLTSGWKSNDSLLPHEVSRIYADSTFVLCPQGNAHMDTFRIMEALQAGAIPVTTKFMGRDFLKYTFGTHPFVVARDWPEAARRVEHILSNSEQAAAYRRKVSQWYQGYLERLVAGVRGIVSEEVTRSRFYLHHPSQTFAMWDVALLLSVWKRFRRFRP